MAEKNLVEKYADLIPMIEKIAGDVTDAKLKSAQYDIQGIPDHRHNGFDSNQISQSDVVPGLRTSGSITIATDATTYTLGTNFNPSGMLFSGVAIHQTAGTTDIRAHVIGNAELGGTYYLQPLSSTSVSIGGPIQPFIQSSSALLIDSSTAPVTVRTTVSEGHIVSVEYPAGTVVARATVTSYGNGKVYLLSSLASGWQIIGNFVIT